MDSGENTAVGASGDWLTVAEFAAMIRAQPAYVYEEIQAGAIAGVIRIGKRRGYRIPRASYDAYVAARLVIPQAA